jgi:glycosyltransferase involved in cell wall biosynthesis
MLVNIRHIYYVSAFVEPVQSLWFSPGRKRKIDQVCSMLSALGYTVTGLNIAPQQPSAQPSIQGLCRSGFVPLRFFQLACSSFCFFSTTRPRRQAAILWLYNTRAAESLVAIIALLLRPRLRLVLQLEDLPSARSENHGLAGQFDRVMTGFLSRRADLMLAVSPSVAAAFEKLNPHHRGPIRLLPPALDPLLKQTLIHRVEPFTNITTEILYAGGYGPDKGVFDLIEAFIRLPPYGFSLRLVGPAPQSLIRQYSDYPAISFMGIVPSSTLFDLYAHADVVVNPHRPILNAAYVFPYKLVEIVASGALPLTTPVPGSDSFLLPPDCFFQGVQVLSDKLLRSSDIWTNNQSSIVKAANICRSGYSFDAIEDRLASALRACKVLS